MFKIAVLVPTYKPGLYFERCLDSIEAQTLPKTKFKVYVALNGPKEDYEKFIFRLLEKYTFIFEYIYLADSGVSNARNQLIEASSEEYVAFADDDDVLSSNYLEQLLLKASRNYISVSNVFSFCESLEELTDNYIGESFSNLDESEGRLFKSRKFFSSPWAKLIHREIIGDARFDEKLKIGEDSLFMAKISKRVRGIRKTEPSACYYVYEREGSASRKEIVRSEELGRITYLFSEYSWLLLKGYNIPFILSRVVASLLHLRRLF
ncbi:glycosyltransferase family 2 protein [Stutzerimonas kunmingensis]|uniref:glycosyltransferase family 2 protein n=1 Tax=Stutzerimonas kunmingensis TaxID=1211807 RepID=UPI0028B018F4|nr:glycosyltransferase family 2 protein [Stutzerimonas kunmingensis]